MRPAFLLLLCAATSGCLSSRSVGLDIGRGVYEGMAPEAIGRTIARGVQQEATRPESVAKLKAVEAELVAGLRDPLTGPETQARLIALERALAGEARRQLAAAREEAVGAPLRADVAALREALIGEAARQDAAELRRALVGPGLREDVDALVRQTSQTLAEEFDARVAPRLRGETGAIAAQLTEQQQGLARRLRALLLIAGAGIAALLVLAWLLFRRQARYRAILEVVTTSIDGMAEVNPDAHATLKGVISRRAKDRGVEPGLRAFLARQGILREEGGGGRRPFRRRSRRRRAR